MIKQIFELLNSSEYLGETENIEIVKGKYRLPLSIKDGKKQFKRERAWRLRKR